MKTIDDYQIGMVVYGRISGIKPYGAFVNFDDDVCGLIHISEISNGFVHDISSYMKEGDFIFARVIDIDYKQKQLRLSYKSLKRNRRENRYNRVPFLGLPSNKIGFKTIECAMERWIKEWLI